MPAVRLMRHVDNHGVFINLPQFDGTPREMGEVWPLRKSTA